MAATWALILLACTPPHTEPTMPPLTTALPTATSPAEGVVTDDAPTVRSDDVRARDAALAERAKKYVTAPLESRPQLSPDEKSIGRLSNAEGAWALTVAPRDGSRAPRRLSPPHLNVAAFRLRGDGGAIFLADERGNERFGIYEVSASGVVSPLATGGAQRRKLPEVAWDRGQTMYFQAQDVATGKTEIRELLATGPASHARYTSASPVDFVSMDRQGKHAALIRERSLSSSELVIADLSTGAENLPPLRNEMSAVHHAAYSRDGRTLYVTGTGLDGTPIVAALDAGTGDYRTKRVVARKAGSLTRIAVDPTGIHLAILTDQGTHFEVQLFRAATLDYVRTFSWNGGTLVSGSFSKHGRTMVGTVTSPSLPSRTVEINIASGRVHLLPGSNAELAIEELMETQTVRIPTTDGHVIVTHVHRPKGRPWRVPVIVAIHGGPTSSSRLEYNSRTPFFVSEGFAVVEPNVRGSSGFGRAFEMLDDREKRLDAVADLARVAQWVKEQPWADPKGLVAYGPSYGGYMTLMALTRQPETWAAGVDLMGVSNLETLMQTTTGELKTIFEEEFGAYPKNRALLRAMSPLHDSAKIRVPLFVYHGANDPRVPKSEADQIVAKVRGAGGRAEYMLAKDEGHSLHALETRLELFSRVVRFLSDALVRKPVLPTRDHPEGTPLPE